MKKQNTAMLQKIFSNKYCNFELYIHQKILKKLSTSTVLAMVIKKYISLSTKSANYNDF